MMDKLNELLSKYWDAAYAEGADGRGHDTVDARAQRALSALQEHYEALRARVARLEEALTPSAETKAAYMGEFSMNIPEFDENGEEYMRPTNIPWTTIKDIMKAIARRALEEK